MLFERIESERIAHYSYIIGDGHQAIVIDPRRDCDIYIDRAVRHGFRITAVLETHRNEDYVIGSVELADRTGAEIWHADGQLDYQYGQAAADGATRASREQPAYGLCSGGALPGHLDAAAGLYDPDRRPDGKPRPGSGRRGGL